MVTFHDMSSVGWNPHGAEYFHGDRSLTTTNRLVDSEDHFVQCDPLSSIQDVKINHDTIFLLTNPRKHGDLFSSSLTTSALNNSATEVYNLGLSGGSSIVDYHFCPTTPAQNKSTEIRSTIDDIEVNYILSVPYRTSTTTTSAVGTTAYNIIDAFQYNMMNLKNTMTPFYEYDRCYGDINRDYNRMFLGTNQNDGYMNMYLGYVSDLTELRFPYNQSTYFHYPYNAVSTPVSASCLIERGATPGDCPENSDWLGMDRYGYDIHTASGPMVETENGQFLCVWLSGNNACYDCSSVWMERWYDPDTVTDGAEWVTSKAPSGSCDGIVDIPSQMLFEPRRRYFYDRLGVDRSQTYLESLKSDLILHIDEWDKVLKDKSGLENDGFIVGDYRGSKTTFEMNGNVHAHVPPTDNLIVDNDISVSVCAQKADWTCGRNGQIVGNYHNGGWGLFFNTGFSSPLITFAANDEFLVAINYEGNKIFEKFIEEDHALKKAHIDYVATDTDGFRWVADNVNNKIYKVDVDDIIVKIIQIPPSGNVSKLVVDTNNNIHVLDLANSVITKYDSNGAYQTSTTLTGTNNNFDVDSTNTIQQAVGSFVSTDSQNNLWKIFGSNLYKNGTIIYHFPGGVTDLRIDSNDNIWVVYSHNRLTKLTNAGLRVFTKKITSTYEDETKIRINFTRENDKHTGCDIDRIWAIYEDYARIIKMDTTGKSLLQIDGRELVNSAGCDDLKLKACGDFTGFDVNRKFNLSEGEQITPNNPSITLKVLMEDYCGNFSTQSIHFPAKNLSNEWHTLGFTYNKTKGEIKLYIDGSIYETTTITANTWKIVTEGTPPIIIGGNSGKLGSENVERAISEFQYVRGNFDDVRVYNKAISDFAMRAIYYSKSDRPPFEELVWNVSTDQTNYLEEVDQFFQIKKPGHKTRRFNIKIHGLDIHSDLQYLIESAIKSSVKKLKPAYAELSEVVWD